MPQPSILLYIIDSTFILHSTQHTAHMELIAQPLDLTEFDEEEKRLGVGLQAIVNEFCPRIFPCNSLRFR